MQKSTPLFFALILASLSAHAGWSAGPVRFKNVHFMSNGVVIAYVEGPRENAPACATESMRFAFDATTPAGKARLAGLLTAYSSGKPVSVYGTGTCSTWVDTESIDYFHTAD